jgi:hypothetical protein
LAVWSFLFAVAYFFNHGAGDQNGGSEPFDLIEAADAGKENDR